VEINMGKGEKQTEIWLKMEKKSMVNKPGKKVFQT